MNQPTDTDISYLLPFKRFPPQQREQTRRWVGFKRKKFGLRTNPRNPTASRGGWWYRRGPPHLTPIKFIPKHGWKTKSLNIFGAPPPRDGGVGGIPEALGTAPLLLAKLPSWAGIPSRAALRGFNVAPYLAGGKKKIKNKIKNKPSFPSFLRLPVRVAPPLKKKQECQAIVDGLRDALDVRDATIESLQKVLGETEMLCSSLKKQIKFLEQQQEDKRSSKEEACHLRNKLKTTERIELLLQSQRPEVEEMIREMGVGQAAVEQLAVYCVSLKKEYENLKEARKVSSEMTEKLKKELFAANSKLQRTVSDLQNTKEELESTQKDLKNADKEILSLKKTIDILQDTLKVPSVTRETLSRLVFESPAPVELRHPKLHRPAHSDEINLDATFDVDTPVVTQYNPRKSALRISLQKQWRTGQMIWRMRLLKGLLPAFIRNSVHSKKLTPGGLLGSHKNTGTVRMGYDGLGGRTKFIQPTDPTALRPCVVRSKKNGSRPGTAAPPASCSSSQAQLDGFLH
uniref:TRAF interacting protein n=1 Tax=Anas platyrhynchos platyrhynchos TaxID=8840 RepID=U3I6F1_ANAPP